MGAFKKLQFREAPNSTLEDIAEKLGGEIDGDFILCPSPGMPRNDRSCMVRVDPANVSSIFIYHCDGPERRAYAHVRELIGAQEDAYAVHQKLRNADRALEIWEESVPAPGTLVERYLHRRAIIVPIPEVLRFHPKLWAEGGWHPAMVAGVSGPDGIVRAIHRTFLDQARAWKATVKAPKKTLGSVIGGAIRFVSASDTVILAEGIETALSVLQETGRPTWSALSAGGLSAVRLPPSMRRVVIAADNGEIGHKAAFGAARKYRGLGLIASVARPRLKDFNDDLMEGGNVHHK
jgi:hypothetical protein